MLHHVGHEHAFTVDARLREPAIQDLPGRSHERLSLHVLSVTGLLANEHQGRRRRPNAENGLSGTLREIARPASGGGLAHVQVGRTGNDRLRRSDRALGGSDLQQPLRDG